MLFSLDAIGFIGAAEFAGALMGTLGFAAGAVAVAAAGAYGTDASRKR